MLIIPFTDEELAVMQGKLNARFRGCETKLFTKAFYMMQVFDMVYSGNNWHKVTGYLSIPDDIDMFDTALCELESKLNEARELVIPL